MVLSGEVQIRRACALRKPSTTIRTTSNRTTSTTNDSEELIHGFKSRILLLDEKNIQTARDPCEKEILVSLNQKALSTESCLQIFLDTAWKDRNRKPIIAEIFHNIAQEYDDESATGLTALLEKSCNDLLNILTLLGRPEINDLNVVTLLANLYRLNDLPQDHQEGVESFLVDIAKAFWPYFVPQKHEIWDVEMVSDAICDVFHTVGKVLEEKCPVNVERTFNKITTMLFTKNTISQYTRLRLMEVKECRAAGWSLPDSARDYYRAAFLKYPRSTTNSSVSSSLRTLSTISPSSSEDDVFINSKAEKSPPTKETRREFLSSDKYEVTVQENSTKSSKNLRHPLVIRIKPKPLHEQNNSIKSTVTNNSTAHKDLGSAGILCPEDERSQNISEQEHIVDNFESAEASTSKTGVLLDQRSGFSSPNVSESNLQASGDFQKGKGFYKNTSESLRAESPPQNISFSDDLLYNTAPDANKTASTSSTPDRSTSDESYTSSSMELSSSSEEKSPHTTRFSRDSSFFRGFSCPETSSPPSFSGSPFSRHNSFSSDCTTGESNHRRMPYHRSYSESSAIESSSSKWGQNPNACDSNGFGQPNSSAFNSWRPNYNRQSSCNRWRSNLEFPVRDIPEGEETDTGSRPYLLSFATSPAALERPTDLTLTPEVEAEKQWLKCVILDEPITVVDRFGQ